MLILALPLFLFFGLLAVAAFAIWIWALVDVLQRQFHDPGMKLIWVLVVIFLHALGALIYLLVGRNQGTLPGARY